MKTLQESYKKNGFTFKQIEREDKKAIYSQSEPNGSVVGHEIFLIQIAKESQAFGAVFPEREKYPSDNDFGITAWSVGSNLDIAMEKYRNLEIRVAKLDEIF